MIEELSPQTIEQIAVVVKDKISQNGLGLGGITDVWVLIALIIPGFITYWIITIFTKQKIQDSQFLTTLFSLILSLVIYLPLLIFVGGIKSINDIRAIVLEPTILTSILLLAISYGVAIGFILQRTKYKNHVKDYTWARFCNRNLGEVVIVTMKDVENKKRIIGKLRNFNDSKDEPPEIVLLDPVQILSGKTPNRKYLGEEIYISASVIQNIIKPKLR